MHSQTHTQTQTQTQTSTQFKLILDVRPGTSTHVHKRNDAVSTQTGLRLHTYGHICTGTNPQNKVLRVLAVVLVVIVVVVLQYVTCPAAWRQGLLEYIEVCIHTSGWTRTCRHACSDANEQVDVWLRIHANALAHTDAKMQTQAYAHARMHRHRQKHRHRQRRRRRRSTQRE